MNADEQAIRELIATWMRASMAGDTDTVLSLMADDVVFMVSGQEPFGKAAFAAAANRMHGVHLEGTAEVRELQVQGDLAFSRTYLQVKMTPSSGRAVRRHGYAMTIFRRDPDGLWRLARDANLMTNVA
jgi:uncharacterized protein (TIGR02246 family)